MSSIHGLITVEEAARLLGVSVQQARRLAVAGHITRAARGLIDQTSVERRLAHTRGSHERAWNEHTAWAAIALLSGEQVNWLAPSVEHRLHKRLGAMSSGGELAERCRDRAIVRTYQGHRSVLPRLRAEVTSTRDLSDLGMAGATSEDRFDGYFEAARLDRLVTANALRETSDGNITLRVVSNVERIGGFPIAAHLAATSLVVAALDATGSLDARTAGVGTAALTQMLERFVGYWLGEGLSTGEIDLHVPRKRKPRRRSPDEKGKS